MRRAKRSLDGVELDNISEQILGAGFAVHTALGPGLLETAYEACFEHELRSRGLDVQRQKTLPLRYKDVFVDAGLGFISDCS